MAVHVRWNFRALQTVLPAVLPGYEDLGWHAVTTPCASCNELIVRIVKRVLTDDGERVVEIDRLVHPPGRSRPTVDSEAIPQALKEDYLEACEVLEISPKASAVLSRRVLQGILKEQGCDSRNLHQQIIDVLAQDGPAALPGSLRDTIDVIRHFGNFSAHPITQETTLQLVDVEPDEAEWCLQIVEELFRHYYVEPDRLRKKIGETGAKIEAHGKELLPKED